MNLAIDIGNTLTKLTIVDNGQVVDFDLTKELNLEFVEKFLKKNRGINAAIMVSTSNEYEDIESWLIANLKQFIKFDSTVPVPLKNLYSTPQTLGPDRLAAAVGANAIYPNSNILIVDFGTAITIDFVSSANEYLGGNISPGARMRFMALNKFTKKLPLCNLNTNTKLIGDNSIEAIESGVVNGIVYEIEGYINDLKTKYQNLRIIFTGGDGDFFAKRLKNPIFATYDLVAYGLNRILEYNAK